MLTHLSNFRTTKCFEVEQKMIKHSQHRYLLRKNFIQPAPAGKFTIFLFRAISENMVESWKKVVLFIGLFERGDDENKPTAEKIVQNEFFMKKIDRFLFDFASQFFFIYLTSSAVVFIVCIQKPGCKIEKKNNRLCLWKIYFEPFFHRWTNFHHILFQINL